MPATGTVTYCSLCVIGSVSAVPVGLQGARVCGACQNALDASEIDWTARRTMLNHLVDGYRTNSNYDVVIGVSGGKDSYFQTHYAIHELGLKPLLVTYHGNNYLPEGQANLDHMRHAFDVDHIVVGPSAQVLKKMNRLGFRLQGDMNWHGHCGIFTVPIQVAVRYHVPLILWGEHGFTNLGGMFTLEDFNEFTFRDRVEHALRGFDWHSFTDEGLTGLGRPELVEGLRPKDLLWGQYPSDEEIVDVGVRGIYLSNFTPWDGVNNAKIAQQYGWQEALEPFQRTYRLISNLDDMHENGVHDYLKFIKLGYGRGTDHACKDIRAGRMTRAEGISMVLNYDHVRPTKDLARWLNYVGMEEHDFDRIADGFRDPRVWWVESGRWHKECIDGIVRGYERLIS
ncbi:MAG: hypothetical protein JW395_4178 [Nitrospira sp.]|nr:hypothetical protein [Nitrospira sp.]